MLGCRSVGLRSVRGKSFKVKQKFAGRSKTRSSTDLALEHFDFFYKPVFGDLWPSVRLGLMSDPKYCALLNNFASPERFAGELREGGALDMFALAEESRRRHQLRLPAEPAQERPLVSVAPGPSEGLSMEGLAALGPSAEPADEEEAAEREWRIRAEADSRSEAGLHDFVEPHALSKEVLDRMEPGLRTQVREVSSLMGREVDVEVVEEPSSVFPEKLRAFTFPRGDISLFPQPPLGEQKSLGWYLMDPASLLPVLALELKAGDSVLDMCAAPGGKSLAMLQTGLPARLVCNDMQMGRMNRLRNMLLAYVPHDAELPEETLAAEVARGRATEGDSRLVRERIQLSRTDGTGVGWVGEQGWEGAFDAVLVDAPCTTDRHALQPGGAGDERDTASIFRRSRSAERLQLPELQTRLLLNALQCVRLGGAVVYSTCTLSPLQNEAVVEAAVLGARERLGLRFRAHHLRGLQDDTRRANLYRFRPADQPTVGSLVLPFVPINAGPMFISKLVRTA